MSDLTKTTTLEGEYRVQEACIDCGAAYIEASKDGRMDILSKGRKNWNFEQLFPDLPDVLPDGTIIEVKVTLP